METILIFLEKIVASGVTGLYVKKKISKIDNRLAMMFEKGSNIETITEYIVENKLEQNITSLAVDIVKDSIVLPIPSNSTPATEDKVDILLVLLKSGFALSNSLKHDLLVPGSPIGPNSFTLFENNDNGVPKIERRGLEINIQDARPDSIHNNLYIFTTASGEQSQEIWSIYRTEIAQLRNETREYLRFRRDITISDDYFEYCDVDRITAGSCYFSSPQKMPDYITSGLTINDGRARIDDWHDGTQTMIAGMKQMLEQQVFPEEVVKEIKQIHSQLLTTFSI